MIRKYLVTGSSYGLGAQLSKKLLLEGNIVFGISRSGNSELTAFHNYHDFKIDVTDYSLIKAVFEEITSEFHFLNGVVHAAAVSGPIGKIEDINPADWYKTININLMGTYNLISLSAKHFRETKSGNFLAISGGGATSPMPRMTAYAASKTGVVRLVESVAKDFMEYPKVTFNSIAPGIMKTQMIDQVIDAGSDRVGIEYYKRILEFKTTGQDSLPRALGLICYLLSSEEHLITGKLISAVWDEWPRIFDDKEYRENLDIHTLRRVI